MSTTPWNVGTRFTHAGARFRATGFLRVETWSVPAGDVMDDILREILVEEGKDPDNLKRLVYCAPEEATVVTGYGVCGCVVPLSEVSPEGVVAWSEEHLAEERARVASRYGTYADLGSATVARLVAAGC